MNHTKIRNLFYGLILLLFVGCEGEEGQIGPAGVDGANGLNSLVNITIEPSGDNCENGGIKVEVGIDNNSNGSLDTGEILAISYVCNGVDGNTSLTSVTTEPAGENCENGGVKIDSGLDTNGDGMLSDSEISATAYICNGIDGNNSLTKITNENAGTNCENGGLKIDSGIDTNGDGILDDSEISATAYVCNGIDGNNSLTKITNEDAGTNCENGGLKIDSGIDTNSDGTLDDTEISATAYVCNGVDGNNSLTKIMNEAAGANCENGGLKIDTGVDSDANGTLDDSEITTTAYVCNGIDGNDGLIKTTNESAGANCENGGIKIDSGIDTNGDGTLDDSEITATAYVCNGVDGNNSLTKVSTEDAGTICEAGGVKVESGIDSNSNSNLDSDEIISTEYVCNGDFDKLVRIDLNIGDLNSSTTEWRISDFESFHLFNFSKLDYTNVDSITFVPTMFTSDINNTCFVQLYNVTDGLAIDESTVESNVNEYIYVESDDIYEFLPNEEKIIGVRVRSENDGISVAKGANSFIFIYRH